MNLVPHQPPNNYFKVRCQGAAVTFGFRGDSVSDTQRAWNAAQTLYRRWDKYYENVAVSVWQAPSCPGPWQQTEVINDAGKVLH